MKPLVSIITPSYNQGVYLEATMQSVLNQTYPQLEYIVVDGGSTDGSPQIIQSYADQLSWWVSEPDQGQADAINKGFRKARGEIIAWLNSDDLYLPWTVPEAVEVFLKNPEAGLVYGDAVSADGEGRLLNELRFDSWGVKELLQFNIICQPAVFMKRSVLEEVGFLDPSYHFFLDHQLWIRLARETTMIHHPRIWAVSRYHAEAKNITMASHCGDEVYRILEWAANEPDLSRIIMENQPQIWAGAYQIHARYLLDGGKPREAFGLYFKAARTWLPLLKEFWHRFLFAGLSALGMGFLGKWYYSLKRGKRLDILRKEKLAAWPGIQIN
ncbi:MAG: glycosyltransferase family 2 protein [Anaerolineales bacterium]